MRTGLSGLVVYVRRRCLCLLTSAVSSWSSNFGHDIEAYLLAAVVVAHDCRWTPVLSLPIHGKLLIAFPNGHEEATSDIRSLCSPV